MKISSRLLCMILVMLLITVASSEVAFGIIDEEEQQLIQEQEAPEPIQLEEETADMATEVPMEMVNRSESTYRIDIGSATLEAQVTSIPGVKFSSGSSIDVLYFDRDTDQTASYIITGTTNRRRIEIETGVTVNIVIDNLNIVDVHLAPIRILEQATANILLRNTNSLICQGTLNNYATGGSGIEVSGTGTLILDGEPNGALTVRGGINGRSNGSGIGGSFDDLKMGTVEILGGTIEATGVSGGPGIGLKSVWSTNNNGDASIDSINIRGGTVIAKGLHGGTGIGTGNITGGIYSLRMNVNITGGTVTADSNLMGGAGIGLGMIENGWELGIVHSSTINITISGGNITARGGPLYPGIGGHELLAGPEYTGTMNIDISGGSITATRGNYNHPDYPDDLVPDIGLINVETNNNVDVHITGGSVLSTHGFINPMPSNGNKGAPDELTMFMLRSNNPEEPFVIVTPGTKGNYEYRGMPHEDGNVYAWLTSYDFDIAMTDAPAIKEGTPAIVEAPHSFTSPYIPGEATLLGSYVHNDLLNQVTDAYFEWGTTTEYGTRVSVTDQLNTTTLGQNNVAHTLSKVTPGTYHYRLVVNKGNISFISPSVTFTSALEPSLDAIGVATSLTEATIQGIYDLNGHNFEHGNFLVSLDDRHYYILTAHTPIRILEGTGVNLTTGEINNTITIPAVTLTGLPPASTIYYQMVITSDGGNKAFSGSFETPGVPITIEYIDMEGKPLQTSMTVNVPPESPYSVSAPEIANYTNVGVIVDSGERDSNKSYYINPSVSQAHTIQFVYDTTSTMLSLSVPSRLVFASFASDGGTLSAPDYQIMNHSSLPVNVTLQSFTADVNHQDGVTMVQGPPEGEDQIQLHLVGVSNFKTLHNLPNGTLDHGFMGQLAKRNQPDSIGEFTFEGNYKGRFGVKRYPRFQAVFTFALELPAKLT
jgi:hypothetical protein